MQAKPKFKNSKNLIIGVLFILLLIFTIMLIQNMMNKKRTYLQLPKQIANQELSSIFIQQNDLVFETNNLAKIKEIVTCLKADEWAVNQTYSISTPPILHVEFNKKYISKNNTIKFYKQENDYFAEIYFESVRCTYDIPNGVFDEIKAYVELR